MSSEQLKKYDVVTKELIEIYKRWLAASNMDEFEFIKRFAHIDDFKIIREECDGFFSVYMLHGIDNMGEPLICLNKSKREDFIVDVQLFLLFVSNKLDNVNLQMGKERNGYFYNIAYKFCKSIGEDLD